MATKMTVVLIILLLPLAANLQQDTDGHATNTNNHLSSFMDILHRRMLTRRRYCPNNICQDFEECPENCNFCGPMPGGQVLKRCQRS
uniref:Ubs_07 putative toxin n=1 Tax=Unedogemmula bisaya TaxID=746885 RepID=A0A098LY00_UNEBI